LPAKIKKAPAVKLRLNSFTLLFKYFKNYLTTVVATAAPEAKPIRPVTVIFISSVSSACLVIPESISVPRPIAITPPTASKVALSFMINHPSFYFIDPHLQELGKNYLLILILTIEKGFLILV
jgi:hypothetical protein